MSRTFKKVEKDASINIANYLIDPNDEGIDDLGNTSCHSLTHNPDLIMFESTVI